MTVLSESDLEFDYDEEEDILLVTLRGRAPGPAITCETEEGHLVRLDPETHELIGAEILGFRRNWEGKDINLEWEAPASTFRTIFLGAKHERAIVHAGRVLA
jgi:hypothetical protein